MSSFFSSDGSFPLQFAIIFVVIFLILAAGVFLIRRLGGKGSPLSGKNSPRGRQPRLGIVDIYELDRQRQLILLRRDNVEHLLLVGGPNDVVIERNILRGMSARMASDETAFDEAPEPVLKTMPEPPVSEQAPVPSLAPSGPPVAPYREPVFEMAVPSPGADYEVAPPLGDRPRAAALEPMPGVPAPEPAAPRQRDSQIARVMRRTPPSLANFVPAAIADRVGLPERGSEPETGRDTPAEAVAAPAPPVSASPVSAPTARGVDAAILSDMARQLEEALRRPSAAVRPAMPMQSPVAEAVAPAMPEDRPDAPEARVEPQPEVNRVPVAEASGIDPIAAAMAATAETSASDERIAVEPRSAVDDVLFADRIEEPELEAVPVEPPAPLQSAPIEPDPVIHAAVADAPEVEDAAPPAVIESPPAAAPTPPPPAPAPAKAPASPNPFSVEEIEAEFARLLGRPLDRKQ
ncbi:hypothetical protein ASG63_19710 [Methylobacterium sp. Leaf94]|uniref:hypothetical protein n=1 Tax=Methylobacterium sp. Leaf94 TaxID=1736250 RepID=UPI0006FC89FF|nr:hypothetical protein [Methylobacterium sp. Leaf94]KQU26341.1 hypothetical protein ASG63_19710 [Methylobacterium sp. Leaf94]